MSWLGVYSVGRGEMGEIARKAAKNFTALEVSADPWGKSH